MMTTERDCAPETLGASPKPRGSHEVCLVHMERNAPRLMLALPMYLMI